MRVIGPLQQALGDVLRRPFIAAAILHQASSNTKCTPGGGSPFPPEPSVARPHCHAEASAVKGGNGA
jgi:hypothetical protein